MDDNNMTQLKESQSEWGLKLLRIILPHITDGIYAMFTEGKSICDATDEQEGWVVVWVYDTQRQKTDICIFVAHDLEAGPCARLKLSHPVPYGLHGSWSPGFYSSSA